ncbi:Toll-Interleukin-Resistance (TIR) domain family protein [Actinidia rufa]|uniref:Toll-Interleukin-Resistance (TIR) domain family protein n=1 Tax=Actinidia rufa TaxID=165716 RepID=A0A7J0G224_9ERIC|nr:Toll-Interleukin-Resistance (TIR) domain family protein [Actinidia rufa]
MPTPNRLAQPCDVFLNHRGIDTKRTVASLLYDHLTRLNLRPFLDNKNMKPGDKLFDKINSAIRECKVIPIFCDVKPSELRVVNNGKIPPKELERFNSALEEAKYTVGLTFNSLKGNLSDVVTSAADIVIYSLIEVEEEERNRNQNIGFSLQNVTEAAQIIED